MNKLIMTVIAFGFIVGCSGLGSIGGSANSSLGSSGGSSTGSSGGSSGGFFGRKKAEAVVLEQRIIAKDTRGLIPVVNEVVVDKYSGGALIKVRGTVDVQGYNNVDLVALNNGKPDENGVLTFEFKGEKPLKPVKGPTKRSTEVYAGDSISARVLPFVKTIRILAVQNNITVKR